MITTQDLIRKIRCLINETDDGSDVSLITDDNRSIDNTILELLPQAVTIVQEQSNGRYVNVKTLPPSEILLKELNDGFMAVVLPSDFASLVSMKLCSWRMPCTHVSSSCSAEALYKSDKKSVAVSSRPVCLEDVADDGKRLLKLVPSDNTDNLEQFVYEAQLNLDEGLGNCDARMADAVSYVCVALLYNVFERYDVSKSFLSFATALCGEKRK